MESKESKLQTTIEGTKQNNLYGYRQLILLLRPLFFLIQHLLTINPTPKYQPSLHPQQAHPRYPTWCPAILFSPLSSSICVALPSHQPDPQCLQQSMLNFLLPLPLMTCLHWTSSSVDMTRLDLNRLEWKLTSLSDAPAVQDPAPSHQPFSGSAEHNPLPSSTASSIELAGTY